MSTATSSGGNSRIARPLSITSILQATSTTTTATLSANRKSVYRTSEYDNKKQQQPNQPKRPTSRLSKSHSMHRLADSLACPSSDESGHDEETSGEKQKLYQQQHKSYRSRALLSRATTTPIPKPSSLIKRFSTMDTNNSLGMATTTTSPTGAAAAVKSASATTTNTKLTTNQSSAAAAAAMMKRSASLMNDTYYSSVATSTTSTSNHFKIGSKVSVPTLNVFGIIRYYGTTQFKGGQNIWIGIELYIKGSGKNDGSIQGVRYFTCAPDTGLFVLATKVVLVAETTTTETATKKTITPRISRTTTTRKSNNMIGTTSPKRNRSATTNNTTTNTSTNTATLVPSKSARTLSSKSSNTNQPLPTRSSPSSAIINNTLNKKPSAIVAPLSATKSTATPTQKLKRSSSLSTAKTTVATYETNECNHRHHHERSLLQQKRLLKSSVSTKTPSSTTTRSGEQEDELRRVSALLEKSRQEKEKLSQQMDGQEAAWERLVSAKESYALRVQEKDDEIMRLKRVIEESSQTNELFAKITAERDSTIARAIMSEAMEKQHVKVIERLDLRIKTLQMEKEQVGLKHETKLRDYAAQIDQLRKQLVERDEATEAIERECSELRKVNVDNLRAYEHALDQLKQQHALEVSKKDTQIERLQLMVSDFTIASPTTPIVDDTRQRLEHQLELSTKELDKERALIKTLSTDIIQLKDEIKRLHRVSVSSSSQFYSIRNELELEIEDKKRIMEEANAALETQSRIEEENERIKMTHDKTQRDLADVLKKLALMEKRSSLSHLSGTTMVNGNQGGEEEREEVTGLLKRIGELETENEHVVESLKHSEQECMRLMDELLAAEKVKEQEVSNNSNKGEGDVHYYKREIEQLKLQLGRESKRYQDLELSKQLKIDQLNKELSDLESLIENKVFMETELEEALENEKQKVRLLETKLKEGGGGEGITLPMSPTSPHYSSIFQAGGRKRSSNATATSSLTIMTSSSLDTVSDHGHNLLGESIYCEICEEYGHEVMTCNAFVQIDQSQHDTVPSSSSYCVNCDVFGTHSTEDCPNQDETF